MATTNSIKQTQSTKSLPSVKDSKQEQNVSSKPKTVKSLVAVTQPKANVSPRAIIPVVASAKSVPVIKAKGISKKYGKHAANYLRRFTPWLRAISDPFCIHGVQIPDPVTTPSSTFTIWLRRTIQVNANGVAAVAFGIATGQYPNSARGSLLPVMTSGDEAMFNDAVGMVSPSDADSTHLFGTVGGAEPAILTYPQWGTVRQLYSQVRVVSAGLRAVYTGNFTTAEGTMTIVSAARDWMRDYSEMTSGALTIAILQSHPDAVVISIPKSYGGTCIYKPLDTESLIYSDVNTSIGTTDGIPEAMKGCEMYIACVGVPEGQAFQVEFCINCEAIPRTNQLDIVNSNTSKYDVVSHETTWNALPEMAPAAPLGAVKAEGASVAPVTAKVEDKLMQPPHPATEKTMIENIVEAIPGVLDKGLKFAEKVSPFLAALL